MFIRPRKFLGTKVSPPGVCSHTVTPSLTLVLVSFRYEVSLYLGFLETHSVTITTPGVDGLVINLNDPAVSVQCQ